MATANRMGDNCNRYAALDKEEPTDIDDQQYDTLHHRDPFPFQLNRDPASHPGPATLSSGY